MLETIIWSLIGLLTLCALEALAPGDHDDIRGTLAQRAGRTSFEVALSFLISFAIVGGVLLLSWLFKDLV